MTKEIRYEMRLTPDEHTLIGEAAERLGWNRSEMMRHATLRYLADFYMDMAESCATKGERPETEYYTRVAKLYAQEADKRKDFKRHAKTNSKRRKLTKAWKLKQAG